MYDQLNTICIIGAGNIGTHLATAIHHKGKVINQVYSRTELHAQKLAKLVGSNAISHLDKIEDQSDIYIIAVPDDAIEELSRKLYRGLGSKKLVVHTSGSQSTEVFASKFDYYGVIYPLQSLSKKNLIDLEEVPFCIYGNSPKTEKRIQNLVTGISKKVHLISDDQRLILHLAAVFANNFSNLMFVQAKNILNKNGLDFDLLKPLILQTANKIMHLTPEESQTGPAIRNDRQTIKKHQEILNDQKALLKLYKVCTKSIKRLKERNY